MSERVTPASNVSPLPGQDQDVAHVEALLEQLMVTSVDADATWSIVRERIGFAQRVASIGPRRRPHRALVLGIAAALMVTGVAIAGVAEQGQPPEQPTAPNVHAPQAVLGTAVGQETGPDLPALMPTPAPTGAGESRGPASPAPSYTSGGDQSAGAIQGSDQQQGQDQQGGGDQQSTDQPLGQDPEGQPDTSDSSDAPSDTSTSTGGDPGASPSEQAQTDQQS